MVRVIDFLEHYLIDLAMLLRRIPLDSFSSSLDEATYSFTLGCSDAITTKPIKDINIELAFCKNFCLAIPKIISHDDCRGGLEHFERIARHPALWVANPTFVNCLSS